jgi:hypothetical protein
MRSYKAIKVRLWVLWDSFSRFLKVDNVRFNTRDTMEGKTHYFIKT